MAASRQQEIDRLSAELAQVRAAMARVLETGQSSTNADAGSGVQRVSYDALVKREAQIEQKLRAFGAGVAPARRGPRVFTGVPSR